MAEKLLVYVGYDSREDIAYEVCRHSIVRRASVPVEVIPLNHRELRRQGLFWRPWIIRGDGQFIDGVDGLPFSTEFSHTRFLVPDLAKKKGAEWALFVDCDFLFLEDIKKLFDLRDKQYPVMCRKFQFHPASDKKMDGMIQRSERYLKNGIQLSGMMKFPKQFIILKVVLGLKIMRRLSMLTSGFKNWSIIETNEE